MSRAGKVKKRNLIPDPVYKNKLVTRYINRLMKDGKKTVAQKVLYQALEDIKNKSGQEPVNVLTSATQNVGPRMEVRPRRVGGASYQVPMEVRADRREALAIRWIITAAQKRSPKEYAQKDKNLLVMAKKLAAEVLDAQKNLGEAIKKRDNTYRMAEANRAFAHFRW
ncbi:MAG: 30S ribosomal protein S7 [Patescibacteria group bacterium]|nr:30S ribosomal protein S7 [Patescibacteria group bacterium]